MAVCERVRRALEGAPANSAALDPGGQNEPEGSHRRHASTPDPSRRVEGGGEVSCTIKVADLFCGAGGTSTGAIQAIEDLGYSAELTAINHWDIAIATHSANHPGSRHYCTSIDDLNPRRLYQEGELDLLWASPECTHHSTARGGRPINDQSRATAWCVTRWAEAIRPKVIMVENVPEFETWGPLGHNGRPLKSRKGEVFQAWLQTLRSLGYRVDHRVLSAADYGDPTTRRRLFVQAVRGRRRICWPEPTHGESDMFTERLPYRTARDIIDWGLKSESIYSRSKPLAENTLRRIWLGLQKYGLKAFILPQQAGGRQVKGVDEPVSPITTRSGEALAQPFLISMEHGGHLRSIDRPINTITTAKGGAHALAEPYLVELRGTASSQIASTAHDIDKPVGTITSGGIHHALAEPYLVEYYGNGEARSVDGPLPTATTKQRFGLAQPVIELQGHRYLLDIRFRMLQPHELAAAQGFPTDYQFTGNKTQVVKQIGNAVPCGLARSLVTAVMTANNQRKVA